MFSFILKRILNILILIVINQISIAPACLVNSVDSFQSMPKPDRRQSKTLILSTNVDKIVRNRVLDCHLSPDLRQIAIKNSVSSDF